MYWFVPLILKMEYLYYSKELLNARSRSHQIWNILRLIAHFHPPSVVTGKHLPLSIPFQTKYNTILQNILFFPFQPFQMLATLKTAVVASPIIGLAALNAIYGYSAFFPFLHLDTVAVSIWERIDPKKSQIGSILGFAPQKRRVCF